MSQINASILPIVEEYFHVMKPLNESELPEPKSGQLPTVSLTNTAIQLDGEWVDEFTCKLKGFEMFYSVAAASKDRLFVSVLNSFDPVPGRVECWVKTDNLWKLAGAVTAPDGCADFGYEIAYCPVAGLMVSCGKQHDHGWSFKEFNSDGSFFDSFTTKLRPTGVEAEIKHIRNRLGLLCVN